MGKGRVGRAVADVESTVEAFRRLSAVVDARLERGVRQCLTGNR